MNKFSRRQLIKSLPAAAVICGLNENMSLLPSSQAFAQAPANLKRRFVLHIDIGSRCGWSSGLLLPRDVGVYPQGSFLAGQRTGSPNPNINRHVKDGNLVFHDYMAPMLRHAKHMSFGVGKPMSLTHGEAAGNQLTGSFITGPAGNPGFGVGVAQSVMDAIGGTSQGLFVEFGGGTQTARSSSTSSHVSIMAAGSYNDFIEKYSDPKSVPASAYKRAFLDVQSRLSRGYYGGGALSTPQSKALDGTLSGLLAGLPNSSGIWTQVSAAITRANCDAQIETMIDSVAVKASSGQGGWGTGYSDLIEALRLAAVLIETKSAQGMGLSLDGHDLHEARFGTAAAITAQATGQLWAQLSVFWDWIISKGFQDEVLVIVSHEFARTPSNGSTRVENIVTSSGPTGITGHGTDHHPIFGVSFLGGRVPPKSRIGFVADSVLPSKSKDLAGTPTGDDEAYTVMQIVGSMLMRVFPDLYPNERVVRDIWSNFTSDDIIPHVVS